jgi:hypothetical protein
MIANIFKALITFSPIINKIFNLIMERLGKDKVWRDVVKDYNVNNHGRPAENVEIVNELQNRINTPKEGQESNKE